MTVSNPGEAPALMVPLLVSTLPPPLRLMVPTPRITPDALLVNAFEPVLKVPPVTSSIRPLLPPVMAAVVRVEPPVTRTTPPVLLVKRVTLTANVPPPFALRMPWLTSVVALEVLKVVFPASVTPAPMVRLAT